MNHPLEQKLKQLRRRLRWTLLLRGVGWTLACAAVVGMAVAALDYLTRPSDPGIRVMLSGIWLVAWLWVAYRLLWRPLARQPSDVGLAGRAEAVFPPLRDRLVSAVEFLRAPVGSVEAGSPALRWASIEETARRAELLDFRATVSGRPARRASFVALAAFLLLTIISVLAPMTAGVAVARLLDPLAERAWPRRHHLVVEPVVRRVARGQPFEVRVVDRYQRSLPEAVWLQWRPLERSGDPESELPTDTAVVQEATRPIGDGTPADEARVARRAGVARPFAYRLVGGDDYSMPWITVEVVEPAKIIQSLLTAAPPACTGQPAVSDEVELRAIEGSTWTLRATSSRPLRSATLELDDGRVIPAAISPDGRRLRFPSQRSSALKLTESWEGSLRLIDRLDVASVDPRVFRMQTLPDAAPSARIIHPRTDRLVLPNAVVPLSVTAEDDFLLESIEVRYGPPRESPDGLAGQSDSGAIRADREDAAAPVGGLVLWQGAHRADSRPRQPESQASRNRLPLRGGVNGEERGIDPREVVRRQSATYDWPLGPLALQPGMQLSVVAVATDVCGRQGRSESIRLSVVTAEQWQEHLATAEDAILGELRRIARLERHARSQVAAVADEAEQLPLGQPLENRLQTAEISQRQISTSLSDPAQGVVGRLKRLRDEMATNHWLDSEAADRLLEMLRSIRQLEGEHLEPAGRLLARATKLGQFSPEEDDDDPTQPHGDRQPAEGGLSNLRETLTRAERHQGAVLRTLEGILALSRRWDNVEVVRRELDWLINRQQSLRDESEKLLRETLGQTAEGLPASAREALRQLTANQTATAFRTDRLREELAGAAEELAAGDPQGTRRSVADTLDKLGRSLALLRRQMPSAAMRSAADELRDNRIARALTSQQSALAALRDLMEMLNSRPSGAAHAMQVDLSAMAALVGALRDRQDALLERTEAADHARQQEAAEPDLPPLVSRDVEILAQKQQRVAEETARVADDARLSEPFQVALRAAALSASAAGQLLVEGRTARATQQAQRRARDQLELVLRQLDRAAAELPSDRNRPSDAPESQQQAARAAVLAAAEIRLLRQWQQDILRGTAAIHASVDTGAELNDEQRASLAGLTEQQRLLTDATLALLPARADSVLPTERSRAGWGTDTSNPDGTNAGVPPVGAQDTDSGGDAGVDRGDVGRDNPNRREDAGNRDASSGRLHKERGQRNGPTQLDELIPGGR